jgi:hypothetical protein
MRRAGGHQIIEQAGRLQKRDEESHLTRRRDRCIRVPVDVDTPGIRIDRHWLITRELNQWLLTFRLHPEQFGSFRHALKHADDSRKPANSTAGFRVNELSVFVAENDRLAGKDWVKRRRPGPGSSSYRRWTPRLRWQWRLRRLFGPF